MGKSEKVLVIGIDGMDPRLTKYHMEQGYMPNLEKLLEAGAAREDLVLLGAHPTITPPMWTTLATGAYPMTHGITDFWRQDPDHLGLRNYALDSRICKAEQMWNVTAEAGKKTLVLHWPGSSWPPTSDSENLFVIDGTNPEGICMSTGEIEHSFLVYGDVTYQTTTVTREEEGNFQMCTVSDLDLGESSIGNDTVDGADGVASAIRQEIGDVRIEPAPGVGSSQTIVRYANSISPIKDAEKWGFDVPEGAKEMTVLFSGGLIRRPALILKNDNGIYDTVKIFKSKKTENLVVAIKNGEFVEGVLDEAIKNDKQYIVTRNMKVLEIAADGSRVRMWFSAAIDINNDSVFHPVSLHKELIENVGYPMPVANLGSGSREIVECMQENWLRTMKWWADAIYYMIEKHDVEVVFSQIHNDDAEKHNMISVYREDAPDRRLEMSDYDEFFVNISKQNDYYIGRFLPLLDEGWTIFLVSDHGLITSECGISELPGVTSLNADTMRRWGFTEVKYDENGNPLKEVDWSKTKAVLSRMGSIYINLKGRWDTGIVEPEDQYALEDEIIAKLYSLRDEKGRAVVAAALRNKDAVLLGLGGPECGDIVFWGAEQHLWDHGDGLSTVVGLNHTSLSPIFVAAGAGIKAGYKTDRVIREVDVTPTIAAVLGLRMPAQCEGAPVYQILEDEYKA